MSPAIPQEIIDSIIETCQHSTDDLKTYSLVSAAWRSTSRRYLFHTLILGGARRAVRFRVQDPQLYRTATYLQQFQELDEFLDNTPYIAEQCIRFVRLRFESHTASPPTYDEATKKMLAQVLSKLTQVQEFDLHLGRWGLYRPETKDIVYTAIRQPSVSKIFIGSSDFNSFPDLVPLLIHSPRLKFLVIRDLVVPESEEKVEDTSQLPPIYLEELRIDSNLRDLVPAILDPAFPLDVSKLHRLRLRLAARQDACELISQLINKCGASLQHLELSDTLMYTVTPEFLRIDLIPNLRSLNFVGFRSTSFHSSLRWVAKVFTRLNSPLSLEEVGVSVMTHRRMLEETSVGENMLWGPCQLLDQLLSGENLPRLRKVKFLSIVRETNGTALEDFGLKIRQCFERLAARSGEILEVSVIAATF